MSAKSPRAMLSITSDSAILVATRCQWPIVIRLDFRIQDSQAHAQAQGGKPIVSRSVIQERKFSLMSTRYHMDSG